MIQSKTVDITPMKITLPVIEMSQYDLGREVIVHMKDGSDWFDLTGYTAKLQGTKPSGFGYTVDGVVDGHDITFASNYDMTSEAGFIPSEVRLTKDGVSLGSLNVILHVEKTPHDVTITDGSPETIIPEMTELVERAEAAAEVLLDCSATATTLPTGSSATASYDVEEGVFTFGIPRGATGAKGDTGVGISTIQKTSSSGLVDTYTITFTDSSTTTFTVTNGDDGNGIVSITKTGTSGLVDTYTITYTNGTTSTYTVTNGRDGTGAGSVTSVATGKGLTGGPITTSGTIKADLVSETNSTQASQAITQVAGRQYAVNPDANGKLSVNVPWDGGANVQSDWDQTDTTADDFIKNKPTVTPVVELTQAQYDALTPAEKSNGTIYCVTDSTGTYLTASEVSYGSGSVQTALDNLSGVMIVDIASFSSLPQTVTNASITANQVCIKAELGTPSAQMGDWTVTTSAGSLTLSGSISGSTTAKLYLAVSQ